MRFATNSFTFEKFPPPPPLLHPRKIPLSQSHLVPPNLKTPLSQSHPVAHNLKTLLSQSNPVPPNLKNPLSQSQLSHVLKPVPTCPIWPYHLFFPNSLFSDLFLVSHCRFTFRKTLVVTRLLVLRTNLRRSCRWFRNFIIGRV